MRKNRVIEQNRCYHLASRLAHRAFFIDDEEKDRAVALTRRVEAGVQAGMSYCINKAVSIISDPFSPHQGRDWQHVKWFFSRCGVAAVAFAAFFGAKSAFAAAMPEEIEKQLSERLPAAFVPIPASGAVKIFPLVSDKRKSPDRKYAIRVDGTPFAITAIGDGGKFVEMSVPAGLHTEEFTNRWFKAEDVFGKIKWKLEPYTPEVPCLAYLSGGKGPLE